MKLVKINWGDIICTCDECICQTEIAYREQGSTIWTTPTNPDNPTQGTEYPILIAEGVYYQVKLTFRGPLCQEKSTYLSVYYPLSSCCPAGYDLNDDASLCVKVQEASAIPPSGAVETLDAVPWNTYTACGSYIYEPGWNINGTGTSTKISTSNAFWKNGLGDCSAGNTTDGPLNRTALWASPAQANQDIGFSVCVDLPASKQYYVGIGTDNYGIIRVDGVTILSQSDVALAAQYFSDIGAPFRVWHIYPIQLTAGPHIIELIGHNVSPPAGIGCEIYDATKSEIMAATSYADLGSKLIFSSKDYVGEPVQIGTGDVAYTCPDGYVLSACDDPIKCVKILYTNKIQC